MPDWGEQDRLAITIASESHLQHFEYKYDASGSLQHIETYDGSISVGSTDFANDVFGRLHNQNEIGPIILHSTTYAYSPGGDIQSVREGSVGGTSITAESYAYQPSRPRLVESMGTTTYGYDLKGRQISRNGPAIEGASQSIEYNDLDLPERITVGGTQVHRFEHDAGGSRTVKRDPATTTVYAGEHYRCTGATNPSSNTVSCTEHQYGVFVGDRLIAEITKDSTGNTEKQRYVHSDHLGSSTLITDETGAIIEKRSFKPFGQAKAALTDTDLRAGFAGHEHDSELGLINMRGRMYDPKLRRFVTPDPFVTEPWNPAGLNRFAYVQNSPLNFVDPSGFVGEQNRGGDVVFSLEYLYSTPTAQSSTAPVGTPGAPSGGPTAYPDPQAANQCRDSHLIRVEPNPQVIAQGPSPSSMAAASPGDQSGGTTITTTGPNTPMGPQRSGDGSGQAASQSVDERSPTLKALGLADGPQGLYAAPAYGVNIQALGQMQIEDTSETWKTIFLGVTIFAPGPEVGLLGAAAREGVALSRAERLLKPLGEKIGTAGTSSRIRFVTGGIEAAEKLVSRLLGGGATRITPAGSAVEMFELAEGGRIGLRTVSGSAGVEATIDVAIEGIGISKIKFVP